MEPVIEEKKNELLDICRRYYVCRLDVFGSAVQGDFTPSSDIDFVVEFDDRVADNRFDNMKKTKIDTVLFRHGLTQIYTVLKKWCAQHTLRIGGVNPALQISVSSVFSVAKNSVAKPFLTWRT